MTANPRPADAGIETTLRSVGVMPVLTVDSVDQALKLAGALRDGGLRVFELTLRTPAALDALAAMKEQFTDCQIGAGTVLEPAQVDAVAELGADFIVTPGTTPALLDALVASELPAVPGAASPSELMLLLSRGFRVVKLFPAAALGGPSYIKAIHGPLAQLKLCVNGGVDAATAPDYLSLPNVICVGGSWMVAKKWLDVGNFDAIRDAASRAAHLAAPFIRKDAAR